MNPASPVYSVPGFPSTLFPEIDGPYNAYGEICEQITNHFLDYDLSISPPWRWVERFHYVIKRHINQWQRLIDSETALRPDDAIYNYDLNESSSYTSENASESTTETTDEQFTSDTPDGSLSDIENYMSAGGRGNSESSGTSTGTGSGSSTLRRYGNIGVMTPAQILGGYREATDFDAYNFIFRDLESLFIGVFDLETDGEFVLTVNPEV